VNIAEAGVLLLGTDFGVLFTANALLEDAAGLDEESDEDQGDIGSQSEAADPADPLKDNVHQRLFHNNVDGVGLDASAAPGLGDLSTASVRADGLGDSLALVRSEPRVFAAVLSRLCQGVVVHLVDCRIGGEASCVVPVDDDLVVVAAQQSRVEGSLSGGARRAGIGSLFEASELFLRGATEERALLYEAESEHAGLGQLAEVRERAVARHGRELAGPEGSDGRCQGEGIAKSDARYC